MTGLQNGKRVPDNKKLRREDKRLFAGKKTKEII